jgi:hypothetical protein
MTLTGRSQSGRTITSMTRTRMLILPTLGLAGLAGLAGCGTPTSGDVAADVADEAVALHQVGFATGLDTDPAPSASAPASAGPAGGKGGKHHAARAYLRRNTLHGEVTVQGKNGVRTIVVQRGAVTAVTGDSVTVKSTDGYSLTWTFADKLRVVQHKKTVAVSTLRTGEQIGVAGAKDGSATDARLIAVE